MKNTIKVLWIIAIVAIIGFSMAACDDLLGSLTGSGNEAGGNGQNTEPSNPPDDQPTTDTTYTPAVYEGYDEDGAKYVLTIARNGASRAVITPEAGDSYTLVITYANGTTKTSTGTVASYSTTVITLESAGNATVTVTITSTGTMTRIEGTVTVDNGTETITIQVTITPAPPGKTLSGIAVTTPPAKTQYSLGEELNTAGMVVTATYSDGSTAAVSAYSVSGYVKTALGNQTLTVTYNGKTAQFTVNVTDPARQTVATPTANPAAGTYNAAQSVTLSCSTAGATIYYTTNGNTPTTASTVYSGAISIGSTATLKAIAVKDGMNNSGVLTAAYTIQTGGGVSGTLTITNIPAEYNGKYAVFSETSNSQTVGVYLIGYQSFNDSTKDITFPRISNGQVNLPMWMGAGNVSISHVRYSGSDNVRGTIGILDSETVKSNASIQPVAKITLEPISFSNGSATVSYAAIFTSVDDFAAWLASILANTAAAPYAAKLNVGGLVVNYFTGKNDVGEALKANKTKYVSLDLSGSTINSTSNPTIDINGFSGCTSLTGMTIPSNVGIIAMGAFEGCTSLASVTIPNSVTYISPSAFSGCTSLASVTIPASVTGIGDNAFQNCAKLTRVTFQGTIAPAGFSESAFPGDLRFWYLIGGGIGTYTRYSDSLYWGGGNGGGPVIIDWRNFTGRSSDYVYKVIQEITEAYEANINGCKTAIDAIYRPWRINLVEWESGRNAQKINGMLEIYFSCEYYDSFNPNKTIRLSQIGTELALRAADALFVS